MTVTGGLAWWNDFVVVACYNFTDQQEQVRPHRLHKQTPPAFSVCLLPSDRLPPHPSPPAEALPALDQPGQRLRLRHQAALGHAAAQRLQRHGHPVQGRLLHLPVQRRAQERQVHILLTPQ